MCKPRKPVAPVPYKHEEKEIDREEGLRKMKKKRSQSNEAADNSPTNHN